MSKRSDHRPLESLEVYAGDAALSRGIQRVTGNAFMRLFPFELCYILHFTDYSCVLHARLVFLPTPSISG